MAGAYYPKSCVQSLNSPSLQTNMVGADASGASGASDTSSLVNTEFLNAGAVPVAVADAGSTEGQSVPVQPGAGEYSREGEVLLWHPG